MNNRIQYTKKAAKQLHRLQVIDRAKVIKACQGLRDFPQCANIKALTHHIYQYRLRVSNFRVFFNFNGDIHIVYVQEVKKRHEQTYE